MSEWAAKGGPKAIWAMPKWTRVFVQGYFPKCPQKAAIWHRNDWHHREKRSVLTPCPQKICHLTQKCPAPQTESLLVMELHSFHTPWTICDISIQCVGGEDEMGFDEEWVRKEIFNINDKHRCSSVYINFTKSDGRSTQDQGSHEYQLVLIFPICRRKHCQRHNGPRALSPA